MWEPKVAFVRVSFVHDVRFQVLLFILLCFANDRLQLEANLRVPGVRGGDNCIVIAALYHPLEDVSHLWAPNDMILVRRRRIESVRALEQRRVEQDKLVLLPRLACAAGCKCGLLIYTSNVLSTERTDRTLN